MEAFSLLKFWRGGGAIGGLDATACGPPTTILTAAAYPGTESDSDSDGDDDGPFFDLEFAVHDGDEAEDSAAGGGDCRRRDSSSSGEEEDGVEGSEVCDGEEEAGEEFNFTLSSSSSSAASFASGDGCAGGSPSDDLFFKGRLVPIQPAGSSSEPNSSPNSKPTHLPVSLMKSATRLRVFMLGLKKSKSEQPEKPPEKSETGSGGKLLSVKLKVGEVHIMSLFARDSNSSRSQKQPAAAVPLEEGGAAAHSSDEKIFFSKEALQRYLKKVKPLYVRVSKRYGEKLRFSSSGQLSAAGKAQIDQPPRKPGDAGATRVKGPIRPGSIPAGLRVVCKHLGKSRSASSAVAMAPSGPSPSSSRRDEALLQQQDGIQSAILHCKRSFNASRDSDSSLLGRWASEPLQDKSMELLRRMETIELNRNA